MNPILAAIYLIVPVCFSAIAHMYIVKYNLFSLLSRPIWKTGFGANKTYRGFFVMIVLCVISIELIALLENLGLIAPFFSKKETLSLGVFLGLGYALPELLNSFIKRRLNIPEGHQSQKSPKVSLLIDQLDSILGCLLVYYLVLQITAQQILFTIVLSICLKIAVNHLLFMMGVRKQRT